VVHDTTVYLMMSRLVWGMALLPRHHGRYLGLRVVREIVGVEVEISLRP
jgi:hypothetical protein